MKPCARDVSLLHVDSAEHGVANLGAGLGDGTKVVDEVGLGHADTSIASGEDLVLLVGCDTDVEVLAGVEDRGLGKRRIANFIESIGGVGDDFTKENLLVAVESVCRSNVSQHWMVPRTRKAKKTY